MTSVESYLVATLFIGLAGFFCGSALGLMEIGRKGEVNLQREPVTDVLGILSVPISVVYAIKWGFVIDGPHFIWVPGLLAWLAAVKLGTGFARQNYAISRPFLPAAIGTFFVPGTYHLFYRYTAV